MDISRPLKQSGLDSSFNSGLTVVSLKKEEKKNGPSVTNDPSGAAPASDSVRFQPLYRHLWSRPCRIHLTPTSDVHVEQTSSLRSDLLQIVSLSDIDYCIREGGLFCKWTPHFWTCFPSYFPSFSPLNPKRLPEILQTLAWFCVCVLHFLSASCTVSMLYPPTPASINAECWVL